MFISLYIFLSNLYALCGAWIHDPETKSCTLHWASQASYIYVYVFIKLGPFNYQLIFVPNKSYQYVFNIVNSQEKNREMKYKYPYCLGKIIYWEKQSDFFYKKKTHN